MPSYPNALIVVIPLWLLIVAAVILLISVIIWRSRALPKHWEAVSADINFAELGTVTIRPNREDIQVAHRAWVELATRKAGVPFDPEYDVVVEIYDSWYELFGRLRELARDEDPHRQDHWGATDSTMRIPALSRTVTSG